MHADTAIGTHVSTAMDTRPWTALSQTRYTIALGLLYMDVLSLALYVCVVDRLLAGCCPLRSPSVPSMAVFSRAFQVAVTRIRVTHHHRRQAVRQQLAAGSSAGSAVTQAICFLSHIGCCWLKLRFRFLHKPS